jgi:putative ABC transport system permease protein
VPIIGAIFPHPDGADVAWEFKVAGIYHSKASNFDENTLFFHWKLFEETMAQTETGTPGVGVYVLRTAPDASQTQVMGQIDALFENGPQVVQTTTDAEFAAQFVSMMGNVPFFVSTIGGAVLIAILLACMNTMLMAAREQTRELGILKALGFTDRSAVFLLLGQAMVLCGIGGLLGISLALGTESAMAESMGANFPGYSIESGTVVRAVLVTLLVGLVAGISPAWVAGRLRPVEALGTGE